MNTLFNIISLKFMYVKKHSTHMKICFCFISELAKFVIQVKVWCTKQESSVIDIDMRANICCVKYNPRSSNYLAVCYILGTS